LTTLQSPLTGALVMEEVAQDTKMAQAFDDLSRWSRIIATEL
jgi:hypothetical protein